MIGRTFASTNRYRYGFNGKELDPETETQDYGMRIYNPGLGRFLSVDPLTKDYPWYTPYQFAGNMPTWKVDIDGLEPGNDKFMAFATASYSFSGKKFSFKQLNFGGGVQYQPIDQASFSLNINNYTKNNKVTFNAFANVNNMATVGVTVNTNGAVKLFGGGTKQSEIPEPIIGGRNGGFTPFPVKPLTNQSEVNEENFKENVETSENVANTNSENAPAVLKEGAININKPEAKPAEAAPAGTNYEEKPPTKEEKEKVNTQIEKGVAPIRKKMQAQEAKKKASSQTMGG